jgi:hypothetical protein
MPRLRLAAATGIVTFAAVWLWVATMPIAFMDAEYPSWRAKQLLLERCALGDTVILGDSRAAADIMPRRLPFDASNLAVGGGEAIEAYTAMNRALACPRPPRRVIISLVPVHFAQRDLFWQRSVRYGHFSATEIRDLRAASQRTGDMSVYAGNPINEFPLPVRDWLYGARFPSLYFASLIHGGGFLRWARNQRILQETLAAKGHYFFGTDDGSDTVASEGHLDEFRPLPILDDYFSRLLALLDERGIDAEFVAMPLNDATWRHVRPEVRDQFVAYLAAYERRFKRFHVVGDVMPHWPDRFFGDRFCHLNRAGAERFSDQLAQRLQAAPPNTQNEAQNGWLSDTEPDASFSVAPISKRGS